MYSDSLMDPSPPDTAENVPVPPYTDVYAPNSEVNQRPSSKASNLAKR
jgi:hypothetical protein